MAKCSHTCTQRRMYALCMTENTYTSKRLWEDRPDNFPLHPFLLNEHDTNIYCTLVHSRTDNCSSDFRYQSSESELGHFLDSCKACASHSHVFPSAFSPLLKHTRQDSLVFFLLLHTPLITSEKTKWSEIPARTVDRLEIKYFQFNHYNTLIHLNPKWLPY
jgi:hypothetical protein